MKKRLFMKTNSSYLVSTLDTEMSIAAEHVPLPRRDGK
jgi:hypothetical protein